MICRQFSVHTAMDKPNQCLFIDFYQRFAYHLKIENSVIFIIYCYVGNHGREDI